MAQVCYDRCMITSLSYSSLSKFDECPERHHREYYKLGNKRNRDDTHQSQRGDIFHKYMEELVNTHINTGDWPSVFESKERMRQVWNTATGVIRHEDNKVFYERSAESSLILVDEIYRILVPMLRPTATEQLVEIDLPHPGKQIKRLRGYIDMLAEPNLIYDWKTRTSPMKWLESDLQATVYATIMGYQKATIVFAQFIFLSKQRPRIELATTSRDVRHSEWLLNVKIPAVIKAIEANIIVPTPGWHCSVCPVPCGMMPDKEVKFA